MSEDSLLEAMRARQAQYQGAASSGEVRKHQLYVIPRVGERSGGSAIECATWPRYHCGCFSLTSRYGDSMLDLSVEEQQALKIVVLLTAVRAETNGAAHQLNWKKVGLSRAYFQQTRLQESTMPTPRAVAAFRFFQDNNEYYKSFLRQHNTLLDVGGVLTISV